VTLTDTVRGERVRDAERTKRRILDAARREFGIKGFDGARVDAIARRARVNKGLIFYYFQSKEELFRVLSEQRIAATLPTDGEPVDWPLFLFAQEEETLDWVRYFLWEGLRFDPDKAESLHQSELRLTSFRQVVEEVRRQQSVGALPAGLDAKQLTFFLYVLGVYPYLLPQMAYLITGQAPNQTDFRAGYERFIRDLAGLLAPAELGTHGARVGEEVLLLSTSTVHGGNYLDYALDVVKDFLGDCRTVHFAPYALADLDEYTATVRAALQPLGVSVVGIHESEKSPRVSVHEADVLFVGGGNSFRLLRAFQRLDLVHLVRERALAGNLRYWGSSAGSNLACPTIRTTNDMPIVDPAGFAALGLIPFQVNPHYADPDANSMHMGETREQRLQQFLEENDVPVLGLREGSLLHLRQETLTLGGIVPARLFQRGRPPEEHAPGSDLTSLLASQPKFDAPA
jgi:dipeptidase E